MLHFEQLAVDSSFIFIEPHTTLARLNELLREYRYAVWETVNTYIMAGGERHLLEGCEAGLSIEEWSRKTQWPHSARCRIARLTEPDMHWERPVAIEDEQSGIAGIASPEAFIRCLLGEKKQVTSFLDTIVETVNDAVTVVDRDGRVMYWNKTAEQVYGISKDDIVGKKIGEHFENESIMLHKILDEGRIVRQIYHQPAPHTHVLISASPIIANNRIIGGVATEQDITRIVRLNEELYTAISPKIEQEQPFSSLIGMGHAFQHSLEVAKKFADAGTPVLLIGETGSGKEMLAQAIHYSGERKNGAFLSLHCGAIPGGLLESGLFGYSGGAFTSEGDQGKAGKLELADGGTLLLEEIGSMPLDIQLKLLHYLKSKSFCRIGAEEPIYSDVRIIAATSSDLQPIMAQGLFLEDLFYQLNVMSIAIPPLRERMEDIPELVQAFIREFTEQYRKPIPGIEPEAMTAIMNYDWPGNIRELRKVMERAIILCDGETIAVKHLPQALAAKAVSGSHAETDELPLKSGLAATNEKSAIAEALRTAYGNKSAAAKLLGISRGTLYNKMREHGIKE